MDYPQLAGVTPTHPVNTSLDEARRAIAQFGPMHPAIRAMVTVMRDRIGRHTKQLLIESDPVAIHRAQGAAVELNELISTIERTAAKRPADE